MPRHELPDDVKREYLNTGMAVYLIKSQSWRTMGTHEQKHFG
jgi:hypothetical protein